MQQRRRSSILSFYLLITMLLIVTWRGSRHTLTIFEFTLVVYRQGNPWAYKSETLLQSYASTFLFNSHYTHKHITTHSKPRFVRDKIASTV